MGQCTPGKTNRGRPLDRSPNYTIMKHILVPTDFSECAEDALKVAAKLARMSDAMLHVAHVYFNVQPTFIYGVEEYDGSATERMRDNIQEQLDLLLKIPELDGIQVQKHCIMNKPLWDIMDLETMKDMDFIVMGSHGSSGVREFFIGSNAQKMIQAASRPVLVVKQYFDPENIENVLFASNFYTQAVDSFKPIKEFIDLLGANIHLLKVITPGGFEETFYSEALMKDFASNVGLKDHTTSIYNSTSVERGINAYIDEKKADLVCIETHGRSGLGHWFAGSLAERVANHSDVPVLTMKIEDPDVKYGVIFPESN